MYTVERQKVKRNTQWARLGLWPYSKRSASLNRYEKRYGGSGSILLIGRGFGKGVQDSRAGSGKQNRRVSHHG